METHYTHLNKTLDHLQAGKQTRTQHSNQEHQQFYQRINNLTNIKLTKEKIGLLNYSLQHSIETISNISHQPHNRNRKSYKTPRHKIRELNHFMAANKLKQINSDNHHNSLQNKMTICYKTVTSQTWNRKCNNHSSW